MSFIEGIIKAEKEQLDKYYNHMFSIKVGDGSLPIENFKYYIIQDLLYLNHYKNSALLLSNKTTDVEYSKYFNDMCYIGCRDEYQFIKEIGDELQIKEYNLEEHPANSNYTSYQQKIVDKGSTIEGAVVLFPCNYLYSTCYSRVHEKAIGNNSWYQRWTKSYTDPAFHESVELYKKLIDRMATEASEDEKIKASECFKNAVEMEVAFVESIIKYQP